MPDPMFEMSSMLVNGSLTVSFNQEMLVPEGVNAKMYQNVFEF